MELDAIKNSETWEMVKTPKNVNVIDSKWVFRQKNTGNGETIKKARLVAHGYQQGDYNYLNVYSPVPRMLSIRVLLSLSINEDLMLRVPF